MFDTLVPLAPDPILGLMAKFRADSNPEKIDLGVGVFRNEQGQTPVLDCVKKAEQLILQEENSKAYVGPAGNVQFNRLLAELVLGSEHSALAEQRNVVLQTPGGCGALRVAAQLIEKIDAQARIWVSNPTWANHVPLLGDAGIRIETYPYYDYSLHTLQFEAMCSQLRQVKKGDYVLLHASCHNPCGADLSVEQWREVADIAAHIGFIPFVDMAYQGFGQGVAEDAFGLRLLAERVPELLFAVSCSKNFGLYRERTGAVGVITATPLQAEVVASHLARLVRGIYSMPPSHGAMIVEKILSDPGLRADWDQELKQMRERIISVRKGFVSQMQQRGIGDQFDFILREQGMFSFLGLTPEQVERMASQFSVYMVDSSRINVAGLNQTNITAFSDALAQVLI